MVYPRSLIRCHLKAGLQRAGGLLKGGQGEGMEIQDCLVEKRLVLELEYCTRRFDELRPLQ